MVSNTNINTNFNIKKIKETTKTIHDSFLFFVNGDEDGENFIHDLLGQIKVPLLGKYNKESYSLADVLAIITVNVNIPTKDSSITLPSELENFLNTFDEEQKIDNNTKSEDFYYKKKDEIKFYWVISQNIFYNDSMPYDVYNIVPHVFLFPQVDFSASKRFTKQYPITMYIPAEIEKSCGIDEFHDTRENPKFYSSVSINKMRIEFSSLHLKGQALAFSPNNLKFIMYRGYEIVHFFLIIMDSDKTFHNVFYYWILNDSATIGTVQKFLKESSTVGKLIECLDNAFGDSQPALATLKNIFK